MEYATLQVYADSGYIHKENDNKFVFYIITKEEYVVSAAEYELDFNLPMRGSKKFFFDKDGEALEPITFDVVEIILKLKNGKPDKVEITEITGNYNPNNTDLSTYFNSTKTHVSKEKRAKKLKEKKDKIK